MEKRFGDSLAKYAGCGGYASPRGSHARAPAFTRMHRPRRWRVRQLLAVLLSLATEMVPRPVQCQTTLAPAHPASQSAAERAADASRPTIEAALAVGRPELVADARAIATCGLSQYPDDALLLHSIAYAFFREAHLLNREPARILFDSARRTRTFPNHAPCSPAPSATSSAESSFAASVTAALRSRRSIARRAGARRSGPPLCDDADAQ